MDIWCFKTVNGKRYVATAVAAMAADGADRMVGFQNRKR